MLLAATLKPMPPAIRVTVPMVPFTHRGGWPNVDTSLRKNMT